MNSGSLGHGLSVGVGMALAGKRQGKSYRVYVVMGDGELAEGSVWEGAMAAGHYRLDNLCAVVDRNRLQISGGTEEVMAQDSQDDRWAAFGWRTLHAKGNDVADLERAFSEAKAFQGKPTVIIAGHGEGLRGVFYGEPSRGGTTECPLRRNMRRPGRSFWKRRRRAMSNKIPNRQVICQVLLDRAKEDKTITVLCSDSRGSASLAPFAKEFPEQFVEMGIAEQSLVSTAAGMARCGLRPFAASPASFLSTRSMEQVKVDVAYSHTNVKLIGISGASATGRWA